MKSTFIHFICAVLITVPTLSLADTTNDNAKSATLMQSTTQIASDSEITSKVKSHLFFDKRIKSLSISVSTEKGIVTLKGNVDTAAQMHHALKIASRVSGVKSVRNDLILNHVKK